MRACILGPPASGKSTVAELLCKKYKLHHITIKEVIDETIQKLEQSAARLDQVFRIFIKRFYRVSLLPLTKSCSTVVETRIFLYCWW